jgi:hypothetical protein
VESDEETIPARYETHTVNFGGARSLESEHVAESTLATYSDRRRDYERKPPKQNCTVHAASAELGPPDGGTEKLIITATNSA